MLFAIRVTFTGIRGVVPLDADIVLGHKSDRNPYGTLLKRLSDFCPVAVRSASTRSFDASNADVDVDVHAADSDAGLGSVVDVEMHVIGEIHFGDLSLQCHLTKRARLRLDVFSFLLHVRDFHYYIHFVEDVARRCDFHVHLKRL